MLVERLQSKRERLEVAIDVYMGSRYTSMPSTTLVLIPILCYFLFCVCGSRQDIKRFETDLGYGAGV